MSPETFEGKIQLAKLGQQISDHIDSNRSDFSDIKETLVRIETKQDLTAGKDEITRLLAITEHKADRSSVESINDIISAKVETKADQKEFNNLSSAFWWLVKTLTIITVGIIVYILEQIIIGHLRF